MAHGLAFLGCGAIAAAHLRTLATLAPAIPRFYASRDRARAAAYAGTYEGAGAFGSYVAAIADERVRAVVVTTPPALHLDLVLAALDAGKDVIVESRPSPAPPMPIWRWMPCGGPAAVSWLPRTTPIGRCWWHCETSSSPANWRSCSCSSTR
jgi:hypothetical protein